MKKPRIIEIVLKAVAVVIAAIFEIIRAIGLFKSISPLTSTRQHGNIYDVQRYVIN